jgi:hypothetical protein
VVPTSLRRNDTIAYSLRPHVWPKFLLAGHCRIRVAGHIASVRSTCSCNADNDGCNNEFAFHRTHTCPCAPPVHSDNANDGFFVPGADNGTLFGASTLAATATAQAINPTGFLNC